MTQYNLGRVCPIFQGDYDPKVSYECLDVVLYEGSSYVAKMDTLGNEPTDPNFWQLVASAGTGGGGTGVVDSELSLTSKNPVQNKVITLKINDLESIIVPEETVRQIVEGYQYMNQSQVETAITSKGFQNAQDVETAIASKNYVPKMGFATINGAKITEGGNIVVSGGAGSTVDAAMSLESENPVQNKVVTKRINEVEAKIKPVPTKVSELDNDSGFQTKSQVDSNISGRGFQTANEVNTTIESKGYTTEAAVNAKGYQTKSEVDKNITDRKYTTLNEVAQQGYVKVDSIPHKVSQLENDSQFQTSAEVESAITGKGYTTLEAVAQQGYAMNSDIPTNNNQLDNGANYTTMAAVEGKGYQTSSDIDARGYQTDAQVKATITANPDGYAKTGDITTAIDNQPTEAWEFELEDGSTITKNILVKA